MRKKTMNDTLYKKLSIGLSVAFAIIFIILVIPAFLQNPDIIGAFAAGFVNPYSSAYALDAVFCALVLATWISYEARALRIKYGWVCILLCFIPGVAVGFGVYLVLRQSQIVNKKAHENHES